MSTLPGQASKGEKTKPKFQSLDINSLYRVSRGENLEKQQQKSSSVYIKHGMQILGKVPNARRAPANLPSLKSEHSGTDAAVPLVPPGAPGWGKQDSSNSGSSPSPNSNQTNVQTQDLNVSPMTVPNQPGAQPQLTPHQAAIAIPVTNNIPPQTHKQLTPTAQPAPTDKLWSSVMSSPEVHPPLYQSVQFQQEFPSLSSGDGGPTRTGSDVPQYPTGLSLRPQTEGSWTQGGQRTLGSQGATGGDVAGQGRAGSGHPGAPPQLLAQAGHQQQQQAFPPQIRGVMPSFMCKGSTFQQVSGIGIQNPLTMQPPINGRGTRPSDNRPPRLAERDAEEVSSRPIIREEELSRMDEISKDMGWAESDEIDYNQKLAFSDDESEKASKKEAKRMHHKDTRDDRESHNDQNRQWGGNSRSGPQRGRNSEEEDIWVQRRTQQEKEVEIAVQRAKQRKEEEEKRFNEERKQAAAKKLMELEEKIQKRDRDNHEGVGTINPNVVPAKPINHVDIPLPDFQKDKDRDMHREKDTRSRTPNELTEEKSQSANQGSSFRQLTQIEGKNFPPRKQHQKPLERDNRDGREQNGPNFSRQFQNDLPPRFLKHQRNNSNSNLQNQQQQYHPQSFDNRWNSNSGTKPQNQNASLHNRNVRQDSPDVDKEDLERKEYKRQSSDDSYRNSLHSQQDASQRESQDSRYHSDVQDSRHQDYDSQYSRREQEQDKWQKEKDVHDKKSEPDHSHRLSNDDWSEKVEKVAEKYEKERERPQRSENRSARHSREFESRDYNMGSWSESMYESTYEDKRKEYGREERRAVPGPITKDRIEADDMFNEKRNLIQLKRGQAADIKLEIKKEPLKKDTEFVSAWADSIPPALEEAQSKLTEEKKTSEPAKVDTKLSEQSKKSEKVDDYNQNRNRSYGQKKGWNNNTDSHSSRGPAWPRRPPSRGHKSGGRNQDYHATDSDGSLEDHSGKKDETKLDAAKSEQGDQRSPKPIRKSEKDDKNREAKSHGNDPKRGDKSERKDNNYVPRGEPSRHGRGGGNFRSGRMGGLGKRIDGYGPPPTKSPFGGHQDEKEKDKKLDETSSSEHTPRVEDKTKRNQQALAAGIIGKRSESRNDPSSGSEDKPARDKTRNKSDHRKNKPKLDEKSPTDTITDTTDDKNKDPRKAQQKIQGNRSSSNSNRARNNPPRMVGEKRYEGSRSEHSRQNSNNSLKKEEKSDHNLFANAIADISAKNRDETEQIDEKEDKSSLNGDAEGFQEVKSKKAVKERQKSFDDKTAKPTKPEIGKEVRNDRDRERDRKKISPATQQLTQQQIQNIPSLMATPVNPPPVMSMSKNQFDRPRQTKLPPRFAKQKLQKQQQQQQQQHHGLGDVSDMNKINQNMNVYAMKDTSVPPPVPACAWDKPLVSQLRSVEHDTMLGVSIDAVKGLESAHPHSPTQGVSPGNEKVIGKTTQIQEKTLLDGATPPVNTIIFENTNFKSAPGSRQVRNDKPRSKLEEGTNIDPSVMTGFNKPNMNELLQTKTEKSEAIQLPPYKEEIVDMKLDFFSADYQFADDKSSKNFVSKSIHAITSGNNTVDSLDIKIASVKKVWETSEQEGEDNNQMSFGGPSLDSNVFNQGKDTPDDNHEVYSPSPNQSAATTNVCKVKPTQQVSGSGQTVLSSSSHQPHSGIVAPSLMGNPLSPPPMAPVLGAGVGLGPQYTANQHIGYQAGLSGSTQYGIPAIPSPPTVPLVYNSTQQIQAAAAQTAGLYGAFQIDQLGGQGRSQFSQYPNYHSLGQTANSPYSTQSVYLPTAAPPPHPPPPTAPGPPELYPNMSNYRLSATAAFGQTQPLNNPTTVLISSTSNSLMSASVKPSSQPISAIGTKTGGVGQAYQQQSQQSQQVYMAYDPSIQANYLASSAGVMQRTPVPQAQNNVVPGLQPTSSYYSGSTGGQTGYFQQPGSSTMSSAQLQQHQAGYGLQGNVFGTHNQSHTNTGIQNFNSHFLTTPMQVAAALNAQQQFRTSLPAAYMKGIGNQGLGDQSTRPQQLKSPSSQEVLSSVFNTGPQIPSPKSRQNSKHPPPQSSPTAQHKYNLYQQVGGQQNPNLQRYPTPIQRPVNFQQMQQNNNANQKHRNNSNKTPNRQYYGNQNQTEKADEGKLTDNATLNNNTSAGNAKSALSTNSGNSVTVTTEKVKDTIKEESAALKD